MKKGFALIAVVFIIVIVGILAASTASFILESLRYNVVREHREQCINLAQAGIYRAIYDYRVDGSYSSSEVNVTGNQWFLVGSGLANYLLLDTSVAKVVGKNLKDFDVENINASETLTIDAIVVTWDPVVPGETVDQVHLDNSLEWTGSEASGTTLDITNTDIPPAGTLTNNRIQFGQVGMGSKTIITIKFIFTDGSETQDIQVVPSADNAFQLIATGKIDDGATIYMRRTILAAYDIDSNEITSWKEIYDHIID